MNAPTFALGALLIFSFPFEGRGQAGETKQNVSAWTVDSLKMHYDALAGKDNIILDLHKEIDALKSHHSQELRDAADKRYEQRFQAQETSLSSYKTTANEFRGTISDTNIRFVSRAELGGYLYGFVVVMGVLVAWLAYASRRRTAEPPWVAGLIKEIRDSRTEKA